ncbi:MAG: hypothetical protein HKM24_05170 [Gammaproteobacteria bacterium]|nr:hypothetical protein [Gammaproteobacteria bacterium]
MNVQQWSTLLITAMIAVVHSLVAVADDTEVLISQVDPAKFDDPNIMFIFDTSGSMSAEVLVDPGEFDGSGYDPAVTYTGTFEVSKAYVQFDIDEDPSIFFDFSVIHCQAAHDAFDTTGYYNGYLLQLADTRWDGVDYTADGTYEWRIIFPSIGVLAAMFGTVLGDGVAVECAEDNGIHGSNANPDLVYAKTVTLAGAWSEPDGWTDDADDPDIVDWSDPFAPDPFISAVQVGTTLYAGNYLNYLQEEFADGADIVVTRIDILKQVLTDILNANASLDINIGLMRLDEGAAEGGPVLHPVVPITTTLDSLLATVDDFTASGLTPLSETTYESSLYYGGDPVYFGNASTPPNNPDATTADNTRYISPITKECQKNYIVVMTDGSPNTDDTGEMLIEALTGSECVGNCLDEMTRYMAEADYSDSLDGDQSVLAYTIGFFTDQEIMLNAATALDYDDIDGNDNDDYFLANDANSLFAAIQAIIDDINAPGQSFVAPALVVNSFNRLFSFDDVYLTLFEPAAGYPHWDGNLKKYKLEVQPDGDVWIVGPNGDRAIDENGQFTAEAQSFWSDSLDGADITMGGMAQNLTTTIDARKIVTNIDGPLTDPISNPNNDFETGNDFITALDLGAADDAERDAILNWAHAQTATGEIPTDPVSGEIRRWIGDPLHSQPTVIPYFVAEPLSTEENPDILVVFGTNDGFLHAIDPNEFIPGFDFGAAGYELYSWIPKDQIKDLKQLKDNVQQDPQSDFKEYGLDGDIVFWIENDANGNGIADVFPGADETAHLIVGMRRGGRNYYSLDVTERFLSPEVEWTLEGDKPGGPYEKLGQTWSKPIVSKIRTDLGADNVPGTDDDTLVDVVLFGGGNNPNQDAQDRAREIAADEFGNAIFMADALTGERLWMASNAVGADDLEIPEMTHSIPSDLRVLDLNRDDLVDRIYVADTDGKLFRIDIDNFTLDDGMPTITGGMIFDSLLPGDIDDESNNRKVYYPPSVARVVDEFFGSYLAVSFTTGHRAHPLEGEVNDRVYSIRDRFVFSPPRNSDNDIDYSEVMSGGTVVNLTDNLTPTNADLVGAFGTGRGWYINLVAPEKGLSSPVAFDGVLYFTTYTPDLEFDLTCNPHIVESLSRLYAVDLIRGTPTIYDNDGDITADDRYKNLGLIGIQPAPEFAFLECEGDECTPADDAPPLPANCQNPTSRVTMIVGTQIEDPRVCNDPVRTYWYQEDIGGG